MNLPRGSRGGVWFAVAAYTLWGLLPLYWRAMHALPLGEVLSHRVLWSAATTLLLLAALRRLPDLFALAKDGRKLLTLLLSALLIGANWSIYIFAVYRGELVQASLGYYINPLMSVAMGVFLLRERLTRLQILAVGLAAAGVLSLGLRQSGPPCVALGLALSFACYGFVKKRLPVDSMLGLSAETLWLTPLAAGYLAWHARTGSTPAFGADLGTTALLVGAGAITLAPLFFFNAAARRLPLSTLGFYQYLSPTIQLAMAVLAFGEPFTRMHGIAFGLIWAALALYVWDAIARSRVRAER
ncbi:MAG: EamA family transporter RarD [Fibrobacteres bacterium]|nr:EamA family transporter RarD [Fibrobacterota bacterium]